MKILLFLLSLMSFSTSFKLFQFPTPKKLTINCIEFELLDKSHITGILNTSNTVLIRYYVFTNKCNYGIKLTKNDWFVFFLTGTGSFKYSLMKYLTDTYYSVNKNFEMAFGSSNTIRISPISEFNLRANESIINTYTVVFDKYPENNIPKITSYIIPSGHTRGKSNEDVLE